MSERADRFRRLVPAPARPRENGDLFEHFGVAVDPRAELADALPPPPEAIEVVACPACGWYRPLGAVCDLCGAAPT